MRRKLFVFGAMVVTAMVVVSTRFASPARADDDPKNLYDVSFNASPKVKKGGEGALSIKIVPKNGGELHDNTPITVGVKAPPGVEFPKENLARKDLKVTATAANTVIEAPFAAKAAAKGTVDADLTFIICNPTNCFRQTVKGSSKVVVE